ncbi:hypothetical protein ACTXG6_31700 [Pseudonocardia sp. Cha107L01]|uniref:hypothetical protein n=1 Tax=Pseudonocardia sp. Cha107L01 TaxID=3457576 RepID=UPI00403EEC84
MTVLRSQLDVTWSTASSRRPTTAVGAVTSGVWSTGCGRRVACSALITALQLEPSAHAPWARTTAGSEADISAETQGGDDGQVCAGGASDVEDEACIDQQPYLQGYLSIDSQWLYHKNKSVIGAQQSVPTGPVVTGQSNIGNILDAVKAGLR